MRQKAANPYTFTCLEEAWVIEFYHKHGFKIICVLLTIYLGYGLSVALRIDGSYPCIF